MDWKTEKEDSVVKYRKDNLSVIWDFENGKYEVRRTDGDMERVLEKGRTQDMNTEAFLYYVEMTWGNNTKNEQE